MNNKKIFVRPKNGILLHMPGTDSYLPKEGHMVDKNSFWIRRLRDGDVMEGIFPQVKNTNVEKTKKQNDGSN